MMMSLRQAHAWLPHSIAIGDLDTTFERVHTDTRTLEAGDLFVALQGENFDAHDFLLQARAKGAAAAIAQRGIAQVKIPGLQVKDSLQALCTLAEHWRAKMATPLIAVTGSNGKTTVTQMIASILRAHFQQNAFATQGNFNNEIGVALTLLQLKPRHKMGVIEMGMNHPGEIATLSQMVRPQIALVNNAQREHLEFMHSVDAVAKENASVFSQLTAQGVAVYPANDTYTGLWDSLAQASYSLRFSWNKPAQVYFQQADFINDRWHLQAQTPTGLIEFTLNMAGRHNALNALAAIACAVAAKIPCTDIGAGLESFQAVKGRSELSQLQIKGRNITLINDSYNANPDSMRAAIDVLAQLEGPRLLIMGDMAEVGEQGVAFHQEAGRYTKSLGIDQLFALGDLSKFSVQEFGQQGRHFENIEDLVQATIALLGNANSVLIKGSRFMRMERVLAYLHDPAITGVSNAA